jgi:hypothetical protein
MSGIVRVYVDLLSIFSKYSEESQNFRLASQLTLASAGRSCGSRYGGPHAGLRCDRGQSGLWRWGASPHALNALGIGDVISMEDKNGGQ